MHAMRFTALCLLAALCLVLSGAAGASGKGDDAVEKILKNMTLKEKVGQMFLADCPADAAKAAKDYHLGGLVLFADDFRGETPDSVRETIRSDQAAAKVPMLIAVDEEGGTVTRVSRFKAFRERKFPSPQAVYAAGGWDAIKEDAREKAALLKSLGVNVNLAPVADLPTSSKSFIYSRSFGTSAKGRRSSSGLSSPRAARRAWARCSSTFPATATTWTPTPAPRWTGARWRPSRSGTSCPSRRHRRGGGRGARQPQHRRVL
jgi:hypothetical protein